MKLFTGLIETTGKVTAAAGKSLTVKPADELPCATGDSISVNGSCLTVAGIARVGIRFDVSSETLSRVAGFRTGNIVNLERAMEAGGRLHGHIVTGHVDCTGTVKRITAEGGFSRIEISYSGSYAELLVEKGSVAVSGISLTVADLTPSSFSVALIPETLRTTSAALWRPGTPVNLEFDIIGKYVVRAEALALSKKTLRDYLEKSSY